MRYYLSNADHNDLYETEIDRESFLLYKESFDVLQSCLSIELNYDIIICNYIDLEEQMFHEMTSYFIRGRSVYRAIFEIRRTLNRRIVNLLTSARMYIDHLESQVIRCLPGDPRAKDIVSSLRSDEYDKNWEYRFMEALRNHVQHRDLPVHWISLRNTSGKVDGESMTEMTVEFALETSQLHKFKQEVLIDAPDKVDLKTTTRRYIESLRQIQIQIREITMGSVGKSRDRIEGSHRLIGEQCNKKVDYAEAWIKNGCHVIENVPLMLDWDDRRIELMKENRTYQNIRQSYISSKPTGETVLDFNAGKKRGV